MPVLKTSEVFSIEAQGYISKFGAKAGLLRMIRESVPELTNSILDGHYISPNDMSYDEVQKVISDNYIINPFLRSTHRDDGVGYIGRLDNIQLPEYVSQGCFDNIGLDAYSKRLGYAPSSATGLYIQERLSRNDVVFGNLVEHPHKTGIFYISGRKKLDIGGTFASISSYGGKTKEDIFSLEVQNSIVKAYEKARETGFMGDNISGQMEFAVEKNGFVRPLQFRAFREKQESTWQLEGTAPMSESGFSFGITSEEGEQVSIGVVEERYFEEFKNNSIAGFHNRTDLRNDSVSPDIPLEKMSLVTADPRSSPFEHGLFEIATLSEIAVFSQFGDLDFPHQKKLAGGVNSVDCRVFSDGQNFRINIEK